MTHTRNVTMIIGMKADVHTRDTVAWKTGARDGNGRTATKRTMKNRHFVMAVQRFQLVRIKRKVA